ncbi:MAG TPA: ATP-binding cassette domain-containing protein [Nitrososphaeraceae archaeon]|nr:ATP-binding cassette domain-containing protein [Nitrososphaeraceae archaeon]
MKDPELVKSDDHSIYSNNTGSHMAIEISNLTKRFENVTALDNLSLEVKYGEIFGLLGPNGSGKTTTINIVSGLSKPTSGQVKILGYDITQNTHAVHAVLGAVPQETALYEELTAWTNMTIHADLYGVPRSEREQRIIDMLNLVQLYERRDNRVNAFSGGMKRRLALARAMLHDPKLLYLDEPTLGVDVQSRRALWDYILDLKKKGKTVLLTTNYLEEANVLCDRLAILDHGKLVALDTPSNLKRRYGDTIIEIETTSPISHTIVTQLHALPGITEVYQTDKALKIASAGDDASTIGQIVMLVTKETALRTISQREPNLDEIFLNLTGSALRD